MQPVLGKIDRSWPVSPRSGRIHGRAYCGNELGEAERLSTWFGRNQVGPGGQLVSSHRLTKPSSKPVALNSTAVPSANGVAHLREWLIEAVGHPTDPNRP